MSAHYQPPRPGHGHGHQAASHATPPLPPAAHSLANYGPPPVNPEAGAHTRKTLFTPYVALWTALGTAAVAYLGYLALSQDTHLASGTATFGDQRVAARLASDVSGIKESIGQVQLELAKLKTDVAGQDQRGKVLSAQLNALERKMTGETTGAGMEEAASAPPPAPVATATGKNPAKTAPAASPAAEAQAKPAPEAPRIVNAEQVVSPADLGLGSEAFAAPPQVPAKTAKPTAKTVAAAASEPLDLGAAVVKPAGKPMGVQISSGASVDSLRLSWSLLSDRHSEALRNLEARYIARGEEASPTFDLIAGPLKSKAEAQKVCKALAAKNVPCKVGDFLGENL